MQNTFLHRRTIVPALAGFVFILLYTTIIPFASAQTEPPPSSYTPLSDVVVITAETEGTTCAMTESGGVECWGKDSTNGAQNILKISEAVAIAGGGMHSCVITYSGGMQCWGYNSDGQLGDGTIESSYDTAVEVMGLPGEATALAAGYDFTCAVISSEVWCWGANDYGQLGDGTTEDHSKSTKVSGLTGEIIAISAGNNHACTLNTSGSVQCWGGHIGNVLGYADADSGSAPIQVNGLESSVVMIASRHDHTCALTNNGEVFCWGMNESGQLGNGETSSTSDAPVQVIGLPENVSAISTGVNHTCAMTSAGQILCWGDNRAGELGDGSNIDRLTPVTVKGLSDKTTAITAGRDYTCAIVDGGINCWGENKTGQLGTGIDPNSNIPVNVSGLTGASAIAAGGDTSCALISDGSAQCWGDNEYGQVGDGTDADQSLPREVQGLQGQVVTLSIGMSHACALLRSGDIQCWGSNLNGKLGTETVNWLGSSTPVSVTNLPGRATVVSAGGDHTCAVIASSVYCWGDNNYGQLGDGTTEEHSTPTVLYDLRGNSTAVSAGFNHTCALTDGGAVLCWGNNLYGQLGNGTTEDRSTPIGVNSLNSGIISIATGEDHNCALTDTGSVYCWGENLSGQLGNGTSEDSLTPVAVNGLSGKAIAIAANHDLTCALLDTGGLQCWGEGSRVGSGDSYGSVTTPTYVSGLTSGVHGIGVGRFHACALLENGSIQCWGTNWNGQLGNGAGPDSPTPLTVVLGPRREEESEEGGYRESGPLVPVITTYIPTPLDVSTKPSVIGTNLLLAALLMLPFAVAAELFTRILSEHEWGVRKIIRPVEWISRLRKRLEGIEGTRFERHLVLKDTIKLIGIFAFYGLVFSLLDQTWKPFSLQGLVLFFTMTIAYGVVGIADDILQWRTIRKWGLSADLTVRPTNFLLAMASTTTSRLLTMVPGLMFGTPEALQTEEKQFDEQKRNTLLRISTITFVLIGLGVWISTIATAEIQKLSLPENTLNLIGGLEGFLLVIFAVTLENLFVQMLGFPGGFGQALKRRNKWLWMVVLIAVTFLFYHTLINPHGELAEALETGNVRLSQSIAAVFVVVAFGLWIYFKMRERRITGRSKMPPLPVVSTNKPAVLPPAPLQTGPMIATSTASLIQPAITPVSPQKMVTASTVMPANVHPQATFVSINETKECPVCFNLIKAEARICRFCKATFVVKIRGYCLTDHEVMEVTGEGKCLRCNNNVTDLHVESRLLKAPAVLPIQTTQAAVTPVKDQTSTETTGATKQCPACGQTIKVEAYICRFCRTQLDVTPQAALLQSKEAPARSSASVSEKDPAQIQKLPAINIPGTQLCPKCSHSLDERKGSPISPYINTYRCSNCDWIGLRCGNVSCDGYLKPEEVGYPDSVRYNCIKCSWTGMGPRVGF